MVALQYWILGLLHRVPEICFAPSLPIMEGFSGGKSCRIAAGSLLLISITSAIAVAIAVANSVIILTITF